MIGFIPIREAYFYTGSLRVPARCASRGHIQVVHDRIDALHRFGNLEVHVAEKVDEVGFTAARVALGPAVPRRLPQRALLLRSLNAVTIRVGQNLRRSALQTDLLLRTLIRHRVNSAYFVSDNVLFCLYVLSYRYFVVSGLCLVLNPSNNGNCELTLLRINA